MDTGKLLRVIQEIQKDEEDFGLQARFQNILNYFNEPNKDALKTEREAIKNDLSTSILSTYAMTDRQVLERIGIYRLFGEASIETIDTILKSETLVAQAQLQEYVDSRQNALSRLESLKNSLLSFGILPRNLREEEYELGFSFPDDYKDLDRLKKVISDVNNFLNALSSTTGDQEPFRISYVSNGTIEIFIHAGIHLAHDFQVVVGHIASVYGEFKLFQEFIEVTKKRFSSSRRKIIENNNKKQRDENITRIINDLIRVLGIKDPDSRNRIKELFEQLLKHLEKGVQAEVRTPIISEPAPPAEDALDEVKQTYKQNLQKYENNKQINEANQQLYLLQKNKFFGTSILMLEEESGSNPQDQ